MTSDKSYDVSQRLDALVASLGFGPWTAFNPLSNGWSLQSPYTGAWVRAGPGNMALISVRMNAGTLTDGTLVGTIPATDSAGNNLRPAQTVNIAVMTDALHVASGSSDTNAWFTIDSAGALKCIGFGSIATVAHVGAGWYPLDSM